MLSLVRAAGMTWAELLVTTAGDRRILIQAHEALGKLIEGT